jgi:hypothetical protein
MLYKNLFSVQLIYWTEIQEIDTFIEKKLKKKFNSHQILMTNKINCSQKNNYVVQFPTITRVDESFIPSSL